MGHRSPPVVANGIVVVAAAVAVVKQATVLGPYTPAVPPLYPLCPPLWHPREGKFFDYALVKVASFVAFVAFVSFVHAKNKSHMFHQAAPGGGLAGLGRGSWGARLLRALMPMS